MQKALPALEENYCTGVRTAEEVEFQGMVLTRLD